MFWEFLLGGGVIAASVVVQVGFIGALAYGFERYDHHLLRAPRVAQIPLRIAIAALWMMAAHSVAVWLWAAAFLSVGAFDELEIAFYFASVCFTTLGFGDIVPDPGWRILAGLSAANGLLGFGISTAVLVELMRDLWEREEDRERARRHAMQRARDKRRAHGE